MQTEIEKIAERYERRKTVQPGRYSRFNPEVIAYAQERQRAMLSLLKDNGVSDLSGTDVLEVGCGSGANLLELLLLGAQPERMVGNELLPDRFEGVRKTLPNGIRLYPGDASVLPFEPSSFDIVYQSTVFSSILDNDLQRRLADAMWRWVRPGGGVLWYDFTFNNPNNPDVRGIPLKRIRELFPHGRIDARRVTLAPPIARRVARLSPMLYHMLNTIPLLRTHVLCFIRKP